MLAERQIQKTPEGVRNLIDLREKVNEKFIGITIDQPLYIALDDFIKETELTSLKEELKNEPQKFINENGKETYRAQVEKVNDDLDKLREQIKEKEDSIGGYKGLRTELGDIFRNLIDLTVIVIAEDQEDQGNDIKKQAFRSTLSFYKGIREGIVGD